MKHKQMYEYLGVISQKQSNGLSVFERTENKKRITECVAGGALGDVVLKDELNKIIIMPAKEWQEMPKDEAELNQINTNLNSKDKLELATELGRANDEIDSLKQRLEKLEANTQNKGETGNEL